MTSKNDLKKHIYIKKICIRLYLHLNKCSEVTISDYKMALVF